MTAVAVSSRRSQILVEGEFPFTERDFQHIATMLRSQSGIALNTAKATLVYSRLAKRLRKLGIASFEEYRALVDSDAGAEERREMFAALTTNVTRFFREPHHFDHLRSRVLPTLVEKARTGGRVRFWSSACSSGEEAYSIALTILDSLPDAARRDVRILATDIDPNILTRARAGVYRDDAVSPIPSIARERWLKREVHSGEKVWRMGDEARALISFKELNLLGQWPMKGGFDVIFCRNVVIYFEEATQAALWPRFASALMPQGRLYVGHSERVDNPAFVSDGLTIYRSARGGAS
jgi:chemotaxis protein methyltransferase CheR